MQELLNRTLVWWRDVPIDVEAGLLSYLSKVWKNTIYIIAANAYEEARKQCNWEMEGYSNVLFITGKEEIKAQSSLIDQLILDDNVLHLSSGIRGGHRIFLDRLNEQSERKCVFIMESPSTFGSPVKCAIKRIAYPVLYRGYYMQYSKLVSGLFAMGREAAKKYEVFGWKKNLEFMYLPMIKKSERELRQNPVVRFLYIGRFDFEAKGIDVLMKAVEKLPKDLKWNLDLVGGYGADKKQILSWCEKTSMVRFVGTWSSNEVVDNMSEYDVCIVPSRYDGWNMTPQQAIFAGIGCISSDGAGSQEIVEHSGAGCVVPKGDSEALCKAIENAAGNPELIRKWKENTQKYADRISVDRVGKYFVEGLNYFYGFTDKKPHVPW